MRLTLIPTPAGLRAAVYAKDRDGNVYVRATIGDRDGVWFRRDSDAELELRRRRGHDNYDESFQWHRPSGLGGGRMRLADLVAP